MTAEAEPGRPEPPGPVYEVTLEIRGHQPDEVDAWLEEHVRHMLELPTFSHAQTFRIRDEREDCVTRVVLYFTGSNRELEEYLAGPASVLRQATQERFGEHLTASRRVLDPVESGKTAPEPCRNCGTPLDGQYCSRCGQRARTRLISIWELVRDAFGDLFELDSRLWQTLIPLMFRPGRLTRDYLVGRRARFMPPFRTYLVLSVVFFLVAFFDPRQQLGMLFEAQEAESVAADDRTPAEIRRQVVDDLAADGIIVRDDATGSETTDGTAENEESGANVRFTSDGAMVACELDDANLSGMPDWLSRRLTRERLQSMCEKIRADSGREFVNRLLDNVPAALFFLLPLMAFVLKVLYPLSKRYYVEHLLFVLHFHAFFFLILTLEVLLSRFATFMLPRAVGHLAEPLISLTELLIAIYIPVYLFKAMRRVYEQGRAITLLKFTFLVLAYLVGFSAMLLIAAFYTAFSI